MRYNDGFVTAIKHSTRSRVLEEKRQSGDARVSRGRASRREREIERLEGDKTREWAREKLGAAEEEGKGRR